MTDRKLNSKGFTLVELIVVIAIMAVLTTVTFYSINMITGAKGKDCANKIETVFEKTRIASQTKTGDHTISLYVGDENQIIIDSSDEGIVECGRHGVKVTYQTNDSADAEEHELGNYENRITFKFKQNSGSFTNLGYKVVKVYANGFYWQIKFYEHTGAVEVEKHVIED